MTNTLKYVATVKQVFQSGIHTESGTPSPTTDRVEIVLDGDENGPCMMYRYTNEKVFCGDTWHETFQNALEQAEFEYGLNRQDFKTVTE